MSSRLREPKRVVSVINEIEKIDSVVGTPFDGSKLEAPRVVDNYKEELLAIEISQSIKDKDVVNKADNRSKLISKIMDK